VDQDLTPQQRAALTHWSTFGRPGEPGGSGHERWVPNEREREQLHGFAAPESTTGWGDVFDVEQTATLLRGLPWREMEDKWVVYSDGPSADGVATVHLHRSWTGFEIVRVELRVTADGSRITGATWETSTEIVKQPGEAFARSTFLEVCRWVLRMQG
jgi:hypothetical protein